MRALVFANGEPPSSALARELAENAGLLVAADGGAHHAIAFGLLPDAVVGDMDSIDAGLRAVLPEAVFVEVTDPETSDLEKAIDFALSEGATAVDVIAAGGGRADHALANLSVLVRRPGCVLRFVDDRFVVRLVEREAVIDLPLGSVVSLVAIGRCEGVTTAGLRWPLREATLDFSPRGIHNEVAAQPAGVSVRTGDLLLFEGRWAEKHG